MQLQEIVSVTIIISTCVLVTVCRSCKCIFIQQQISDCGARDARLVTNRLLVQLLQWAFDVIWDVVSLDSTLYLQCLSPPSSNTGR